MTFVSWKSDFPCLTAWRKTKINTINHEESTPAEWVEVAIWNHSSFFTRMRHNESTRQKEEKPGAPLFFCLCLHVCPAATGLRDEEGRGLLSLNTAWLLINEVTGEDPTPLQIAGLCLFWLHLHRWMCPTCQETMGSPV